MSKESSPLSKFDLLQGIRNISNIICSSSSIVPHLVIQRDSLHQHQKVYSTVFAQDIVDVDAMSWVSCLHWLELSSTLHISAIR